MIALILVFPHSFPDSLKPLIGALVAVPVASAGIISDLIESITAYYDDGAFTEIAYFRSEEEARQGEQQDIPPDMADTFALWEATMRIERFLDLRDPWLVSA